MKKSEFTAMTCPHCGGNKYHYDDKIKAFVCDYCLSQTFVEEDEYEVITTLNEKRRTEAENLLDNAATQKKPKHDCKDCGFMRLYIEPGLCPSKYTMMDNNGDCPHYCTRDGLEDKILHNNLTYSEREKIERNSKISETLNRRIGENRKKRAININIETPNVEIDVNLNQDKDDNSDDSSTSHESADAESYREILGLGNDKNNDEDKVKCSVPSSQTVIIRLICSTMLISMDFMFSDKLLLVSEKITNLFFASIPILKNIINYSFEYGLIIIGGLLIVITIYQIALGMVYGSIKIDNS